MTKRDVLMRIYNFFKEKGVESMTLAEYRSYGNEVPIKDFHARRYWGSWNRIVNAAKRWEARGANPLPAQITTTNGEVKVVSTTEAKVVVSPVEEHVGDDVEEVNE